ncbi:13.5 kDa protein [Human adenovirus 11a]|uniref:13.5 kDa protein n=1 Tax=Human adenovirus B serotype 11 (strain BC34) TaxID=343463 RepID=D2DM88_ADE1A|nr:13.5 kDa protein [Human adenovirus 11a]
MTSALRLSVSKNEEDLILTVPLEMPFMRFSSIWSENTIFLLSSLVANDPYRALDKSLAMDRMVWFFSLSARSLAAMLSWTYSRARHFHSGKIVVNSSGTILTCHPRLCKVIKSTLVATSPRRGSLVQQSLPPFLEQKGGSGSSISSSGGSASMVKIPGSKSLSK